MPERLRIILPVRLETMSLGMLCEIYVDDQDCDAKATTIDSTGASHHEHQAEPRCD